MNNLDEKACTKCGETKSTSEFYKHCRMKDGLASHCKACQTQYQREHKDHKAAQQTQRKANQQARKRIAALQQVGVDYKIIGQRKLPDILKNRSELYGLSDLKEFPNASGVYVVRCLEVDIYVGEGCDVKSRWAGSTAQALAHNKLPDILEISRGYLDNVTFTIITTPGWTPLQRKSLEWAIIQATEPQLNQRCVYPGLDFDWTLGRFVSQITGE